MKKNFTSLAILLAFLAVGFFLISHASKNTAPISHAPADIKYVEIGGQSVKVDLALTPEAQAQGLSGRASLGENEGMLFVFGTPGNYLFWMKDMNFPIDMVWLAPSAGGDEENAKIIYIEKNATPESYPATYGPASTSSSLGGPGENDQNAKYVLEVPAGFADKNNLKVGDSVHFR